MPKVQTAAAHNQLLTGQADLPAAQIPAKGPKPGAKDESFDDAFDRMGRESRNEQTAEDEAAAALKTGKETPATGDGDGGGEAEGEQALAPVVAAPPATGTGDGEVEPTAEELWAGLNDKQKAALQQMSQRMGQLEHQAASDANRVSAFQRKINDLTKATGTAAAPAPSAQLTAAALAGDPAAWKQLEEDYPTIAKPIRDMAARTAQTIQLVRDQMHAEMKNMVSPLLQRFEVDDEARQQTYMQTQVNSLTEAYPDWQATKGDKKFTEWLQNQAPGVQNMIKSHDARDAIHVLDLYTGAQTSDTGAELTARRAQRRQQAAAVPGMSGRAVHQNRPQQIPDDFDAAWDVLARQSASGQKQ